MIVFTTVSGSVYQVKTCYKQIRRTTITQASGDSQRVNTEWRPYDQLSDLLLGESALIIWGNEVEVLDGSPEYAARTTMTSVVVNIQEVPDEQPN